MLSIPASHSVCLWAQRPHFLRILPLSFTSVQENGGSALEILQLLLESWWEILAVWTTPSPVCPTFPLGTGSRVASLLRHRPHLHIQKCDWHEAGPHIWCCCSDNKGMLFFPEKWKLVSEGSPRNLFLTRENQWHFLCKSVYGTTVSDLWWLAVYSDSLSPLILLSPRKPVPVQTGIRLMISSNLVVFLLFTT